MASIPTRGGVEPVTKYVKKSTGRPFLSWPSRPPDLNPRDFWLWPVMQNFIDNLEPQPRNEEALKVAAHQAAAQISEDERKKAVKNLLKRCEKCIELGGAWFEYALK